MIIEIIVALLVGAILGRFTPRKQKEAPEVDSLELASRKRMVRAAYALGYQEGRKSHTDQF